MERKLSWDRYRGLAILMMVVVNDLSAARGIPSFLKHSPGVGYTLADVVAPMFIFAMGLTYAASFHKRFAADKMGAYMNVIKRNLTFIGLGAIFSGVGVYFAQGTDWGVLQALGVAGLMSLAVIRLKPLWRTAVAIAILAIYQCALALGLSLQILAHLHGGMLGALSWGAMLMLTTALVELYTRNKRHLTYAILMLAVGGAALSLIAPISKNLVSISYVCVSLALCGALFHLTNAAERWFGLEKRRDFLCDWGENPLALYLAHYALIGLLHLPNLWFDPPVWVSLVRTLVILLLLNALAKTLHRKNIRISL